MNRKTIFTLFRLVCVLFSHSQINVSTIEDVVLPPDSFYDASSGGNGFQSGQIFYPTYYDTTYQFWSGGFAASNKTDSVTSGYTNQFSAKTASGYNASSNYALGQNYSTLHLTGSSLGDSVLGFYITNTTYAYNSMRDGDFFAKKFGGPSGNDPDWFLISVRAYKGGLISSDSVYFYLADFRFTNNANDYILSDWQWVDCHTLGKADSLFFTLFSSDNGSFGMNTPGYFAIDNVTTQTQVLSVASELKSDKIILYPNPALDVLRIDSHEILSDVSKIFISDMAGKIVHTISEHEISSGIFHVDTLTSGLYFLNVIRDGGLQQMRFIKN